MTATLIIIAIILFVLTFIELLRLGAEGQRSELDGERFMIAIKAISELKAELAKRAKEEKDE